MGFFLEQRHGQLHIVCIPIHKLVRRLQPWRIFQS
jgi:hypothetical protein